MRITLNKYRNETLVVLSGISLMLVNFIMVQHVTIAIRQMEVSVLIFTLSYFSGISLGYYFSDKISKKQILKLLPWFLVAQMLIIIFIQPALYIVSEAFESFMPKSFVNVSLYAVVFVVMMAFVTSLYAVFLPMIIEEENNNLRRFYSLEVLGSLLGLGLLPLLASVSHEFLLSGYFLTLVGIAFLLKGHKIIIVGLLATVIGFGFFFNTLDQQSSKWFYQQWYKKYDIQKVLHTLYTPYHKIEVLGLKKNRRLLVLNGKKQFGHWGHFNYSYFVAEYPAVLIGNPSVAVLGCGSMSTVGRIGKKAKSIKIVELDKGVFDTSREYFSSYNKINILDNWEYVSDDAKHFLATTNENFDLILDDIPPARSRQIALTYTQEFFKLVKQRLTKQGLFSMPSLIPLHAKSTYGKKLIATMASVFDKYFVIQLGKTAYFFGGTKGMIDYDRETLKNAIKHKSKNKAKVFLKDEVDLMVKGTTIITINNMADLIYDK